MFHCMSGNDCGQFVGYVDDRGYSYSHRDPIILTDVLSTKFREMKSWMNANKLVVNADKTHLIVIRS